MNNVTAHIVSKQISCKYCKTADDLHKPFANIDMSYIYSHYIRNTNTHMWRMNSVLKIVARQNITNQHLYQDVKYNIAIFFLYTKLNKIQLFLILLHFAWKIIILFIICIILINEPPNLYCRKIYATSNYWCITNCKA